MSGHPGPQWPSRLCALLQAAASPAEPGPCRRALCEETWLLLRAALVSGLERQARRCGPLDREDLEDLASEKSLELVLAAEEGKWRVEDRSPGEIAGYLASVARNAVVDHLRRCGRMIRDPGLDWAESGDGRVAVHGGAGPPAREVRRADLLPAAESPDAAPERREFTAALAQCLASLPSRSQRVWLLRVLFDMSARDIAAHPDVEVRQDQVDVVVHRARHLMGRCMRKKGFDAEALPPGTFAELWRRFRIRSPAPSGGAGEEHEIRRIAVQPSD